MNSRSGVESPLLQGSTAGVGVVVGKVKNNFSIDHLLAKDSSDSVQRERNVQFLGSHPNMLDTNRRFLTPDSSCGPHNVDFMDNCSEDHQSEESYENGKCASAWWNILVMHSLPN